MIIHLFGHREVSLYRAYHCINIPLMVFANSFSCLSKHHFPSFFIWLAEPAPSVEAGNVTASQPPLQLVHGHMAQSWPKGPKGKSEEFLENVFFPSKIRGAVYSSIARKCLRMVLGTVVILLPPQRNEQMS